MGTNLYCSCSNAMFYLKTLYTGNQHNIGSCIFDVLSSDRLYLMEFLSLTDFPHVLQADMSVN